MGSVDEFERTVLDANADISNIIRYSGGDVDVGLCLLDSCYNPGSEFSEYNKIGRQISIFSEEQPDSGHWRNVINILVWTTANPIYHFIKAIGTESGKFSDTDLLRGFGTGLQYKDEIDVINLSQD